MLYYTTLDNILDIPFFYYFQGEYLGPAHSSCNLNKNKLKPFMNIFMHNFTGTYNNSDVFRSQDLLRKNTEFK